MVKSGYDARSEGGEGGEAPEERHRRQESSCKGRHKTQTNQNQSEKPKKNWEEEMCGAGSNRNKKEMGIWRGERIPGF